MNSGGVAEAAITHQSQVTPNLGDYDEACRAFAWESARTWAYLRARVRARQGA